MILYEFYKESYELNNELIGVLRTTQRKHRSNIALRENTSHIINSLEQEKEYLLCKAKLYLNIGRASKSKPNKEEIEVIPNFLQDSSFLTLIQMDSTGGKCGAYQARVARGRQA